MSNRILKIIILYASRIRFFSGKENFTHCASGHETPSSLAINRTSFSDSKWLEENPSSWSIKSSDNNEFCIDEVV